jgi:predicted GTPase
MLAGKAVLVVDDGSTITHGEMASGPARSRRYAGVRRSSTRGVGRRIDRGSTSDSRTSGTSCPAMGYGDEQLRELEETINAIPCDVVVTGTPIDLGG